MGRPRRGKITDPDLARLMALAEPSRWAMVRLLAQGARSVGEVAEATRLSLAVASRHLQRLRAAGLVSAAREGKVLVCELAAADSPGGRWLEVAFGLRAPGRRRAPAAEPGALAPRAGKRAAQSPRPRPGPAPRRPAGREMEDFLL
jgi:DNA-binding transcriptional ArsR family regulator